MSGQLHQVRHGVRGCSIVRKSRCCELVTLAGCSVVGTIDQINILLYTKHLPSEMTHLHVIFYNCLLCWATDSMLCQQNAANCLKQQKQTLGIVRDQDLAKYDSGCNTVHHQERQLQMYMMWTRVGLLTLAGCRAVPGMSPADYREALYSTWMTDRPWGMKLINCDSDGDDITYSSADEVYFVLLLSLGSIFRIKCLYASLIWAHCEVQ